MQFACNNKKVEANCVVSEKYSIFAEDKQKQERDDETDFMERERTEGLRR